MKSFKYFVEEQKHTPKQVDNGFGLIGTMPETTMLDSEIDPNILDKLIKRSVSEDTNQLVALGQKMMVLAPKEKDDKISNAYAKLGDALTRFGTTFSSKNMADLEKNTGMKKELITMLIKRAQKQ